MPCRVVLPTSSMSRVRTHFCTLVARGYGAGSRPVRYGMNGTMPATVNSSDGSGRDQRGAGDDGVAALRRSARGSGGGSRRSACRSTRFCGAGRAAARPAGVGGVRCRRRARRADRAAGPGRRSGSGASRPVPGAQLGLALGRGGADVGAEVADGVGEVAQALGDASRPMPAGVSFSAAAAELADDQGADGDAHGQPEQPAHQAARRAARRARRASLSRRAASASAWPSRFFLVALRTP